MKISRKQSREKRIGKLAAYFLTIVLFVIPIEMIGNERSVYGEKNNLSEQDYEKARIADELRVVIDDIFQWKKQQEGIQEQDRLLSGERLEYAGSSSLDWYVFAMGRCGYEENYQAYAQAMKEQIIEKYKTEDKLDANSATEWHRQILTLLAIGEDPAEITDDRGNVINLVADGTYDRGKTKDLGEQGLNGYIWALLALDSKGYQVPENAADSRESMVTAIISSQNPDGGFALVEGVSDVDMTAMALQALAPYYEDEKTFSIEGQDGQIRKKTVGQVVDDALEYLSICQLQDGTMENNGEATAESTAQVITALSCLEIDLREDQRFIKNGKNLLDGMLLFRNIDGGFSHLLSKEDRESNSLVGEQTARALAAYVRLCLGENSIYDFRGEESENESTDADGNVTSNSVTDFNNNQRLVQYHQLQKEIGEINRQIQTHLYPFEDISKENSKLASELVNQIEKMPEYVKEQILEYDKLCNVANEAGETVPMMPVVILTAVAIVILVLCLKHGSKNRRKNKINAKNEEDWSED